MIHSLINFYQKNVICGCKYLSTRTSSRAIELKFFNDKIYVIISYKIILSYSSKTTIKNLHMSIKNLIKILKQSANEMRNVDRYENSITADLNDPILGDN